MSFRLETGLVAFTVIVFVLGFFMSLGKAAVFKHIPVYYPKHVGSVGGVVGLVGGLGGFVLPILFGMLNDLTGVWQSCFMALFAISAVALVWMHLAIRAMEKGVYGEELKKLPELPEMQEIHEPKHVGALGPHLIEDWRPEEKEFWETKGRAIARRNLFISIPALLLSFAVWMVWSVVVAKLPSIGFTYTTDQLFWLAALPGLSGATLRIFYSFMVPIFGGRLWTTLDHLVADHSGASASAWPCRTRRRLTGCSSPWRCCAASAAATSPRPCRTSPSSSRRRRRATRWLSMPGLATSASASCSSSCRSSLPPACSVGSAASRIMIKQGSARDAAVAAECRLHLGAVHHCQRVRRLVWHA